MVKAKYIQCDNDCGAVFCSDICASKDDHECDVETSVDIPDDAVL
jgi:hypothetical protein